MSAIPRSAARPARARCSVLLAVACAVCCLAGGCVGRASASAGAVEDSAWVRDVVGPIAAPVATKSALVDTTVRVRGSVVDRFTRRPVVAASVSMRTVAGTQDSRETKTDANGSYEFLAVPRERISIRIAARGFKTVEHEIDDPSRDSGWNLLDGSMPIAGVAVWEDGTSASGITLHATCADDDIVKVGRAYFGRTDAGGRFSLSFGPGRYRVCGDENRGDQGFAEFTTRPVPAGTSDVRVVLRRPHVLRGRVVDEAGAPVAGASVGAVRSDAVELGVRSETTDAEGAFALDQVPADGFGLIVLRKATEPGATGLAARVPSVRVEDGEARVVVHTAFSIEGTLTRRPGASQDSPLLVALPLDDPDAHIGTAWPLAMGRKDGRFRFDAVPPGRWRIVSVPHYRQHGVIERRTVVGGEEVEAGAKDVRLELLP